MWQRNKQASHEQKWLKWWENATNMCNWKRRRDDKTHLWIAQSVAADTEHRGKTGRGRGRGRDLAWRWWSPKFGRPVVGIGSLDNRLLSHPLHQDAVDWIQTDNDRFQRRSTTFPDIPRSCTSGRFSSDLQANVDQANCQLVGTSHPTCADVISITTCSYTSSLDLNSFCCPV